MERLARVSCLLFLLVHESKGFAASCAVATAAGADNCKDFRGTLNISRCAKSSPFSSPVINCNGKNATITIKSAETIYTADFVLGKEEWGVRPWTVDGKVRESNLKPAVAPSNKVAEQPTPKAETEISSSPGQSSQPIKSFRFDYDVSFSYSDNGFDKLDGEPKPSSTITSGQTAYLGYKGEVEDVTFDVYVNLMSEGPALVNAVEIAKASKNFGSMFSASVGRTYLNVGGWENKNWIFSTIFVSPYTNSRLTFADMNGATSATMMQGNVNFGLGGMLSLQLTDDVYLNNTEDGEGWDYFNKAQKQPVPILEWSGTYGSFTPLVQFVSYDINHSTHTAVGLKIAFAGLVAYLDYITDVRAAKLADGTKNKTTYSNAVIDLSYATKVLTPFAKYSNFNAKQPDTDQEGNIDKDTFDDNSQIWMVGTNVNNVSAYFSPYLAYISRSADVLEDFESGDLETKASKASSTIVVGIGGSI